MRTTDLECSIIKEARERNPSIPPLANVAGFRFEDIQSPSPIDVDEQDDASDDEDDASRRQVTKRERPSPSLDEELPRPKRRRERSF